MKLVKMKDSHKAVKIYQDAITDVLSEENSDMDNGSEDNNVSVEPQIANIYESSNSKKKSNNVSINTNNSDENTNYCMPFCDLTEILLTTIYIHLS